MPTPPKRTSAEKLALYEKVLQTNPKIERKGDANPYPRSTETCSRCCTPLGTLAFRLPDGEREKFLKKYKTTLFEAYGSVMKEYVVVPDSLLKQTPEFAKYLAISYAYAKTLKPKAAKKK